MDDAKKDGELFGEDDEAELNQKRSVRFTARPSGKTRTDVLKRTVGSPRVQKTGTSQRQRSGFQPAVTVNNIVSLRSITPTAAMAKLHAKPIVDPRTKSAKWQICDVCNGRIYGVFYQCNHCKSWDCCENCASKKAVHFDSMHTFTARHAGDIMAIPKAFVPKTQAELEDDARKEAEHYHAPLTPAVPVRQRRKVKDARAATLAKAVLDGDVRMGGTFDAAKNVRSAVRKAMSGDTEMADAIAPPNIIPNAPSSKRSTRHSTRSQLAASDDMEM